ncbi:MAG: metal ABC transporter permease [Desulfurococcaceae archaeon]
MVSFILMGGAMSSASVIVYYRRLEFLVAEAVHASLFSVIVGLVMEFLTGINYLAYSVAIGLFTIYATSYLIKAGIPPEKATATVAALMSALAVLIIHYTITKMPIRYSLHSLILGDPLLLTREESLFASAISASIIFLSNLSIQEIIGIGIDDLSARLTGVRVKLYDFLAYTIIGVISVGMLRLAGYVMEHVFLLLPPVVFALYAKSMKEHILMTVILGTLLSALGYVISFALDTSPTGITGLLFILLLAIKFIGGNK